MRSGLWALWLAVAAVLGATPAWADLRATYRMGAGEGAAVMTVEVSDAGAFTISMPIGGPGSEAAPLMYGTAQGETVYGMVSPGGRILVRSSDFMALMDEFMSEAFPSGSPLPAAVMQSALREVGSATVNGREGRLFVLEPPAAGNAAPRLIEIVVSNDPALAPLARALAGGFAGVADSPLFQRLAPPALKQAAELMRTHALLFVGGTMELTAVETVTIPEERFALPGTPISRDSLRAMLDEVLRAVRARGEGGPLPFTTAPVRPEQSPAAPDTSGPAFDVDAPPPPPEPE